jgi:lipoprotein signal peptidase
MSRVGRTVGVGTLVVVIDYGTKYLAFHALEDAPLVRLSRNADLALGSVSLSTGLLAPLLVVSAAALLFGHAQYLFCRNRLAPWAIGCLAGGALANGIDRLATGAVHDWLALRTVSANVADAAILLGLVAYVRSAWNPA